MPSELQNIEGRKPIRVLIADDDPVLRSLVAANLAPRVDTVTEAGDGCQAWDLLLNRRFELAMIDLSMPNIDGFTLIQCMRGHPRTKHMPIIVVTSSNDRQSIERAFEAGATSFLTKPVNWGLFGHHIDYLIRLSQSADLARTTMLQAEAIARSKDAVIAMLAARIKSHTGGIIAAAERELAPRGASPADASTAELAKVVLSLAGAIAEVCDSTLPFLRSASEQIVIDDRPVLLERLLDGAIRQVATSAMRKSVHIELGRYHRHTTVRCDEAAMSRAIGNLLRNAVQHTPDNSVVAISIEQRDDNVLAISVIDAGPGADPATIAACLRPLDRVADADEEVNSGLGLPMTKAIAQAHGGTLEISTAPGEGTIAVIVLPAEIVEIGHEQAA